MRAPDNRQKLSTTISAESYAYLRRLVKVGKARNLAEAVDLAVTRLRRAASRARLELDTAAYFATLSNKATAEEAHLESALGRVVDEISFES